jgi:CTP synthase (UTP-ammonia lyase)
MAEQVDGTLAEKAVLRDAGVTPGMIEPVQIGLIGDYSEQVVAHVAIPQALRLAGQAAGCEISTLWFPTQSLDCHADLSALDGLWCVPGSPYENMNGALEAIRFAREMNVPFLGTCGGFQHAVIEYARNVLGKKEADHAESNPGASLPLISPLSCSLADETGRIRIKPGSRAAMFYGHAETEEAYNCNYGVNPRFQSLLEGSSLQVTGWDQNHEVRIVELNQHPFFIATLFQPERSALKGVPHPLIVGFVSCLAQGPHRTADR